MKKHLLYILALLLTACTDDVNEAFDQDKCISFGIVYEELGSRSDVNAHSTGSIFLLRDSDTVPVTITVDDFSACEPAGRAAPIQQLSSFTAWAFLHDGTQVHNFFSYEEVTKKGSDWSTSNPYYWPTPTDKKLSFTALSELNDNMTVDIQPGNISLGYTVPASAAAQSDIALAQTEPINHADNPGIAVPLTFRHLCAAVRFRAGPTLTPGTIKRITLTGVSDRGVFSGESWSLDEHTASFSLDTPVEISGSTAPDSDLYQTYQTFMFLPQSLGPDASLEVEFYDVVTGRTRTLTASLAGHLWPMGKITTYNIGVTPDFKLEFTSTPPVQDAHYVMCNSTFTIDGFNPTADWTLTATANDGADVSIQREADVNEYAKQGFWLDRRLTNGSTIGESVRGTSAISGTGNVSDLEVRVYLPENVSSANRTVTLRLHVEGSPESADAIQTITQLCPSWSGNTGWEQLNDSQSGIYGFCYAARHVYVYNNSHATATANNIVSSVQNMITQYQAEAYATVTRYSVWDGIVWKGYRNYVDIDYRKLNNLNGKASSTTNGLQNTRELFTFGGTATSKNFENAIISMRRVTDESQLAYRERASNDPSDVPNWINGEEINNSQMLLLVLKKNRYYLNTTSIDDGGMTTTSPLIKAEDINWYLPASGQFGSAPSWYGNAAMTDKGAFWSSTVPGANNAYTGSGASETRTNSHYVRAARNR